MLARLALCLGLALGSLAQAQDEMDEILGDFEDDTEEESEPLPPGQEPDPPGFWELDGFVSLDAAWRIAQRSMEWRMIPLLFFLVLFPHSSTMQHDYRN